MRITEAAARLGMSPRMLRYREDLGLLPPLRDRPYGRGHAHRQFTEEDLAAITAALAIERRFDITPAALAFGLRVLTDPAARAAVADLGRRTGHVPAGPGAGRALDFEKERALRALGGAPRDPAGRLPGYPPAVRGRGLVAAGADEAPWLCGATAVVVALAIGALGPVRPAVVTASARTWPFLSVGSSSPSCRRRTASGDEFAHSRQAQTLPTLTPRSEQLSGLGEFPAAQA